MNEYLERIFDSNTVEADDGERLPLEANTSRGQCEFLQRVAREIEAERSLEIGLALGASGVRGLLLMVPGNIPRVTNSDGSGIVIPPLDWRVLAFTMALALLTGIVFGLFPALHTSRPDLVSTLKEASGRSGTGVCHKRIRSALVVVETALSVVLLVGAALLIRSFVGLRSVESGLDARNVFTFQTSLAGSSSTGRSKRKT